MGARRKSVFKLIRHEITLPSLDTRIKLIPVSDVHRDHPGCDVDRLKAFFERGQREDDDYTFYIILGDLLDFCSDSEREILASDALHESTKQTLDRMVATRVQGLLKEMAHMTGRTLGIVGGNHMWQFSDGSTSTDMLCKGLKCPYLGALGYVRLSIGFEGTTKRQMVNIVATHGKAGGKLVGTSINQVEGLRDIFVDGDIYLMGHDHHKSATPVTVLEVTGNKELTVKQKRQWLCRTGSFLRGYVPNTDSYEVARLYRPNDLGVIRGEIDFRRDQRGGADCIVKDIHFWS